MTDPAFLDRIHRSIKQDLCTAQSALARLQDFYQKSLGHGADKLFQDRMADIRDIVMRLSSHLSEALKVETGVLQGR